MRRVAVLLLILCISGFGKDIAGKYAGDWASGSSGVSGAFRLVLESLGEGKWKLEVTFTLAEQEVKTSVQSLKVEGETIEAAYDFDLAGNKLRSAITGRLNGEQLEGTYKTTAIESGADVDQGVWKATSAK